MGSFTPNISKRKDPDRVLTEMQKQLLKKTLEYEVDAVRAARDVGYSNPYEAIKTVKDELIEMAEDHLARLALKSTAQIERALDSQDVIVQLPEKLKAALMVLDRTNPRTNKLDINGENMPTIFILPDKVPLTEDEQE